MKDADLDLDRGLWGHVSQVLGEGVGAILLEDPGHTAVLEGLAVLPERLVVRLDLTHDPLRPHPDVESDDRAVSGKLLPSTATSPVWGFSSFSSLLCMGSSRIGPGSGYSSRKEYVPGQPISTWETRGEGGL